MKNLRVTHKASITEHMTSHKQLKGITKRTDSNSGKNLASCGKLKKSSKKALTINNTFQPPNFAFGVEKEPVSV